LLAEVVEVQVREQAVEQVDIKLVLYRFLEALHIRLVLAEVEVVELGEEQVEVVTDRIVNLLQFHQQVEVEVEADLAKGIIV
jgi:hypothetical protein